MPDGSYQCQTSEYWITVMDLLPGILLLVLSLLSVAAGVNNEFPTEFYGSVVQEKNLDNIVVSPSSVREALARLYLGTEGLAASELKDVLNLVGSTKYDALQEFNFPEQAISEVGSRLYIQEGIPILPRYQALSRVIFNATAESVDFNRDRQSVARLINERIAERTHNKIPNVVSADDFDPETKLVLVNAVYFKFIWKYNIDSMTTEKRYFHMPVKNGQGDITRDVDTMIIRDDIRSRFNYTLDAEVINIPYDNFENLSMLIILPRNHYGLAKTESKLHLADLRTIVEELDGYPTILTLPKFQIRQRVDLKEALKNIGIRKIFDKPDLSSLTGLKNALKTSKVLQEVVIEVDGKGSEPAAASVSIQRSKSLNARANPRPIDIRVDHPFLFAIRDSQRVYFIGRVSNLS